MRIYKRLKPIKAMSFDLDDTLYDNMPTIYKAEQALTDYLAIRYPAFRLLDNNDWLIARRAFVKANPQLRHDLSEVRRQFLLQAFESTVTDHETHASQAFDYFIAQRNKVEICDQTVATLKQLKQSTSIVAITNGNLQVEQTKLAGLFDFVVRPDKVAMKPSREIFQIAINKLNIPMWNILHVGDNLRSDVMGAARVGMQTCWFDPYETQTRSHQLPNIVIDQLQQLTHLKQ